MRNLFYILLFSPAILFLNACNPKDTPIERETNFNSGWKFIRADISGAEIPEFDDSAWRTLILPHDYSIEDLPEKEDVKQIGPLPQCNAFKNQPGACGFVGNFCAHKRRFT